MRLVNYSLLLKKVKFKERNLKMNMKQLLVKEIFQVYYIYIRKNVKSIIGTQLIRRNDELALLYEKIKIQQSTLAKGQAQYSEKLNLIDHLKIEIANLVRGQNIYRKQVIN